MVIHTFGYSVEGLDAIMAKSERDFMHEKINAIYPFKDGSFESGAQTQNNCCMQSGVYQDAGEMMCGILGKEQYCEVMLFFLEFIMFCVEHEQKSQKTTEKSAYFVVFMTRRCHVLKMIFFSVLGCDTFQQQLQENWFDLKKAGFTNKDFTRENIQNFLLPLCKRHFITDFNLLSMDYTFAQYYRECGSLPDLMIADEVLLHGRTMNRLLGEMEQRLMDAFEHLKKEAEKSENSGGREKLTKETIRDAFQKNTRLAVYAQKADTLLLYSRYAADETLLSQKRSETFWREISLNFAQIVSSSDVNNVAFSWSFVPKVSDLPEIANWILTIPKEMGHIQLNYRRIQTTMQEIPMMDHLVLMCRDEELKAVWSFRIKKSLTGKAPYWMIVPYFVTGKIENKKIWSLFLRIKKDIQKMLAQQEENIISSARISLAAFLDIEIITDNTTGTSDERSNLNRFRYDRVFNIVNLFLNCLFIKKFLGPENSVLIAKAIEWDHLSSNFSRFDPESGLLQDVRPALELLWSLNFGVPEEYLDFLLDHAEGMNLNGFSLEQPTEEMIRSDSRVENEVLDIIDQMGITAEKNAYEHVTSSMSISEKDLASWGGCYSIWEILQQFSGAKKENNLYVYLAELIQAMDLGIISMNTHESLKEDRQSLYTMVKAGEQALFIKPIRYRHFISLLYEIESKHYPDRDAILRETRIFIRNNIEFIKQIDPEIYETLDGTESQRAVSLFEKLQAFLQNLYDSGQRIAYWQIPLSLEKKKIKQMRESDALLQDAYIHQYHQMYGYY